MRTKGVPDLNVCEKCHFIRVTLKGKQFVCPDLRERTGRWKFSMYEPFPCYKYLCVKDMVSTTLKSLWHKLNIPKRPATHPSSFWRSWCPWARIITYHSACFIAFLLRKKKLFSFGLVVQWWCSEQIQLSWIQENSLFLPLEHLCGFEYSRYP